jgi:Brp/Blh family beta-carotene 15,15'-monooxygenase
MKNYFGAIFTLLYVLSYLVVGPWDTSVDYVLAGVLLFTTGIPHGAGDHLIAQKIASRENLTFHLKPFILFYVGIMLAYAVLWYITPLISFIIFIAISVFHFGDMEDLDEIEPKQTYISIARTVFLGSGILSFILFSHWPEAVEIISKMQVDIPATIPDSFLFVSIILLALGFQKKNFPAFINTFLTLIIGYFLPLIPAFICYFSCCHAIYSFKGMKKRLELTYLELYKKLIPFSVMAFFIGIGYIFLTAKDLQLFPIFIFLSLLTLPHFLLMHKLIKRPN